MGPLFTWIIADTVTRTIAQMLMRRCSKCGNQQVVAKEALEYEVPCERCGTPIPPNPQPAGWRS